VLGDEGIEMGPDRLKIRNAGSPRLPMTKVIFNAAIVEAGSTVTFEV